MIGRYRSFKIQDFTLIGNVFKIPVIPLSKINETEKKRCLKGSLLHLCAFEDKYAVNAFTKTMT